MRHKDHGAFKVAQSFHQHFFGCEIQVIGRLVKHQKIRRVEKHAGHGEPGFLTARERPDFFLHVVSRELKCAG